MTLAVVSHPEILVVQLKRFEYNRDENASARLDTKIKFPLELNYVPDETYSLVAVGRHEGSSMHAGHYFAWGSIRKDVVEVQRQPRDTYAELLG